MLKIISSPWFFLIFEGGSILKINKCHWFFFVSLGFGRSQRAKQLPWERFGVPNPGGRRGKDGEGGGGEQKRLYFG